MLAAVLRLTDGSPARPGCDRGVAVETRNPLRSIDRTWPLTVLVAVGVSASAAYQLAAAFMTGPVLLQRLEPNIRGILYGSLATSAGALLGLTIASIAILLTLDEKREPVAEMQKLPAWRILNATLLTAATFLALTLLVSTIALGLDATKVGNVAIETAVFATACVAFAELAVGGAAFALIVVKLTHRT